MTKRVTCAAADSFSIYDFTNDAKFESMRSYPRGKQVFRAHVDIEKRFQRRAKIFNRQEKVLYADADRQIHKAEERFLGLLKHTYDSNDVRSGVLKHTYSKWVARQKPGAEFDTIFDGNISAMMSSNNELYHENRGTPLVGYESRGRMILRVPSRRSISVDNIPRAAEVRKLGTLRSRTNLGGVILRQEMARNFRTVSTTMTGPVKDSVAVDSPLPPPAVEQT